MKRPSYYQYTGSLHEVVRKLLLLYNVKNMESKIVFLFF